MNLMPSPPDRRAPGLAPAIAAVRAGRHGRGRRRRLRCVRRRRSDARPTRRRRRRSASARSASTVPAASDHGSADNGADRQDEPLRDAGRRLVGDEVAAVQERLKELGLRSGPDRRQFGTPDQGLRVGVREAGACRRPATEATGERDRRDVAAACRSPSSSCPAARTRRTANHTEIYLPEQVVIFFRDDKPALITHMSSGTGEEWCEEVTISPGEQGNEEGTEPLKRGECGISKTPGGVFAYDRQRVGRLGERAGHDVEPDVLQLRDRHPRGRERAARAGLARLHPDPDDDRRSTSRRWSTIGDQVFVFDGVKEPEEYSERDKMPIFNWLDPDYSTTTTTLPSRRCPGRFRPASGPSRRRGPSRRSSRSPTSLRRTTAPATETTAATLATN